MSALQGFLNSKEGQDQLNNIMSILGSGNSDEADDKSFQNQPEAKADSDNSQSGGMDFSSLMNTLNSMLGGNEAQEVPAPNIDINTILKLQQVFSALNKKDKNTELLLCLKPHFSKERQLKVDRAISMMKLFSMLPAIKESGLFNGL